MPLRRVWTDKEVARLKEMIEKGLSAQRIALALRRPTDSIKQRARQIGMPFPHDVDLKRERKRILGTTGRFSG